MLFSIVAISYNQPWHVEALCASLVLMDFDIDKYEIILVDDGSISPISTVINLPQNINFRFIYLPRDSSSCRAKARNAGAALARGEYLVFIDGDCLVGGNFLKNYEDYFVDNTNVDVVLGSFYCIDYNKKPDSLTFDYLKSLESGDPYHKDDSRFYLEKISNAKVRNMHAPWLLLISRNFVIKNKLFRDLSGFDERFIGWGSEDTEFAYRICKAGIGFELLPNKVYHISENTEYRSFENKYRNWIENIGLFYSIHKDPVILLLMTQERLIFDSFVLGKAWDHQFQLKSFLALKQKIEILKKN